MHVLVNDWRMAITFFFGMGVLFGMVLCAYLRVIEKLRNRRSSVFRCRGEYEILWLLVSISVPFSCLAIFFGIDSVGREFRDPNSPYLLFLFISTIVGAVFSIFSISKLYKENRQ